MANKNPSKIPNKFSCIICHYYTSSKKDYDKHLCTAKHRRLTKTNDFTCKNPKKIPQDNQFLCSCGKSYKHMSSLCKHKSKCEFKEIEHNPMSSEITDKALILLLLKQNSQLIEQTVEFAKNGVNNMTNSHNTNSNNKTFNLQFFLNETCKDAMNIMDFVDSLKIQLSDLENVGKLGFVDGISNIIVKNLQALDVNKRPVHCSDSKREVMYIKDEDKWEKENEEKNKMRKVIKHVAHKNSKMLPEFKSRYPDCIHSSSVKSDQYNKIIIESMGGFSDDKENKIIKKIAKEVVIDK
jgi:hypothetical protein